LIYILATITLFGVIGIGLYIWQEVSENKEKASISPTIIVNSPTPGESVMAGSFLMANVTATGQNPISRIELWLDGTLFETQTPPTELGDVTTFYATANIPMTEGQHMFSARAVDSKGLIGQNFPINVLGSPRLSKNGDEPYPNQPPEKKPPGSSNPDPKPPAPPPQPPPNTNKLIPVNLIDVNSWLPTILSNRPKAPTSMQAGFENCTIRLVWTDNSTNEDHFKLWMQGLGGPPKVIANLKGSPQTGPAWYEFASPWTGIYSFWVEAVNGLGGQSSEIVWVGINDLSCGPGVATHLNIETLDMYIPSGHDQVYCYLSVESWPEKRIPSNDGQFVQVLAGWGNIANWTGNGNSLLVPEPQDNEVKLEGKCMGRKGGSLPENLGTFQASAPRETWDGRRLDLIGTGTGYRIGYRIQPHGPGTANGLYGYNDYTIPTPSQPTVIVKTTPFANLSTNTILAQAPTLAWDWKGDQAKLTGFTILLDGKPVQGANQKQAGSDRWEDTLYIPTSCGGVYKFQIVTNFGEAQSIPSPVTRYEQTSCGTYAKVKFNEISFSCLDDGDIPMIEVGGNFECGSGGWNTDTIEAFYWIHANGNVINIFGGDLSTDPIYSFHALGLYSPQRDKYASYDTFIVPIDPQNPTLRFGLHMRDEDPWWDADDNICLIGQDIIMPYQDWANYEQRFDLECHTRDANGRVTIDVKGLPGLYSSP